MKALQENSGNPQRTPLIETVGLTKHYGKVRAVQSLSIQVEPGEILGFLGPNGAGKTTTVKMLTGMILPTAGSARVAGFDILKEPLEAKKRIGYVPETGALYESLTAYEYLELIAHLHSLQRKAADKRISELLELFDLQADPDMRMSEFSKGMKQKVILTAALLHNPSVMFLDEPLNGLDANAALVVKKVLRLLSSQGKAFLFCSHVLEVVERICTRIVIINKGEVIADGSSDAIARETGQDSLESAFHALTGIRDAEESARDVIAALDEE